MATAEGFRFDRRKNGDIVIFHHGRIATILRGDRAAEFVTASETDDHQELMARATGNYKHGNERVAASHPRNRV
jgi:hypothetical protein